MSGYFNHAIKTMGDATWAYLTSTIKVMLVTSAYTYNQADDFISSGAGTPGGAEIAVTGYTGGFGGAGRKSLASKTITEVDGSSRTEFSSAGLTWTALAAGATIAAAILIFEITNDAASLVIAYCTVTSTPTNGGDVTVNPGTGGWFYGSTV